MPQMGKISKSSLTKPLSQLDPSTPLEWIIFHFPPHPSIVVCPFSPARHFASPCRRGRRLLSLSSNTSMAGSSSPPPHRPSHWRILVEAAPHPSPEVLKGCQIREGWRRPTASTYSPASAALNPDPHHPSRPFFWTNRRGRQFHWIEKKGTVQKGTLQKQKQDCSRAEKANYSGSQVARLLAPARLHIFASSFILDRTFDASNSLCWKVLRFLSFQISQATSKVSVLSLVLLLYSRWPPTTRVP